MSRSNNAVKVTETNKPAADTTQNINMAAVKPSGASELKIEDVDLSSFTSKSAKMRHLASLGFTTSSIAKLLDVKYQFVRNVLNQKTSAAA